MENPASMQATLADIFMGNCGHYDETQWITTKLTRYTQIPKQYVKYTIYLDKKFSYEKNLSGHELCGHFKHNLSNILGKIPCLPPI